MRNVLNHYLFAPTQRIVQLTSFLPALDLDNPDIASTFHIFGSQAYGAIGVVKFLRARSRSPQGTEVRQNAVNFVAGHAVATFVGPAARRILYAAAGNGFSYDVRQRLLQNQLIQVSYNGTCCGIALEFRRLALGPVRTENQFRLALIIANIGTFGNVRRQEKIF